MKNLKYVYKLLFVLPLIFMVSCDNSDDIKDVITKSTTALENTVFIETDDTHEASSIALVGTPETITVGVNNSLAGDITVSFNVTRDGGAAVYGVDYVLDDVTILGSEYFGSSDISFFTSGIFEVTIASASGGSLEVVGNKAIFSVPPAVTFTITWADPFYDYDIYLVTGNQDFGGTVIASSLGVTNLETFTAYPTLGFSSVFLDDWWGDNASIPVTLTVDVDGDVNVYPVIMDMDKWVLLIETTIGEDGFPDYDFTAL